MSMLVLAHPGTTLPHPWIEEKFQVLFDVEKSASNYVIGVFRYVPTMFYAKMKSTKQQIVPS